jgi:CheY-like chemotaxis protein
MHGARPAVMDTPPEKKTILIVDSDFAFSRLTARALRPHQSIVVETLALALEVLEQSIVHAVVFDPEQPDGFDFLVALATRFRDVRSVVYTMSREAQRAGAFGTAHATLLKPAGEAKLREAVLGCADTGEFRIIRSQS